MLTIYPGTISSYTGTRIELPTFRNLRTVGLPTDMTSGMLSCLLSPLAAVLDHGHDFRSCLLPALLSATDCDAGRVRLGDINVTAGYFLLARIPCDYYKQS